MRLVPNKPPPDLSYSYSNLRLTFQTYHELILLIRKAIMSSVKLRSLHGHKIKQWLDVESLLRLHVEVCSNCWLVLICQDRFKVLGD